MISRILHFPGCSLAALLVAALPLAAPAQEPTPEHAGTQTTSLDDSMPQWYQDEMNGPVVFDYYESPLAEVAEDIRINYGVPAEIDNRALQDVGLGSDSPITLSLSGVSLKSALNLMLQELDLTWTIRDEVLLITTPEEVERELITHVYPVGDLVRYDEQGGSYAVPYGSRDFDSLIDVITRTVAPETWDEVGGPGAVDSYTPSDSLIISQTFQVHEKIERLLGAIREAKALAQASAPPPAEPVAVDEDALLLRIYRLRAPVNPGVYMQLVEEAPTTTEPAVEPGEWEEQVAEAIVAMVEPESWKEQGGQGDLRAVSGVLFVRQTTAVHTQIKRVLDDLAATAPGPRMQPSGFGGGGFGGGFGGGGFGGGGMFGVPAAGE